MEKNFALLIVIYLLFNYSKKNFNIKEKNYIQIDKENTIKKTQIEIFEINKQTKIILLDMIKKIHNIFIQNKILYYISDELLYGYKKNKKLNKYCEYINIYVIEETFDIDLFKQKLRYTDMKILRNFGFYKIISDKIDSINKYSICINLFLVEKVKDKIKHCGKINEWYFNLFQLKKNEHEFDDIFPLQKVRFENMYICIPNDPEKILEGVYGKNYKNNKNFNNIYSPLSYLYTKITGIRNKSLSI